MTPYDYALLAQEAYSAVPDIGQASSASRAIVRQTAAGLVVAFPGTDNRDCWGADFSFEPINVCGVGKVHSGFWTAWMAIASDVKAAVGNQSVTLVGHSLGAALAICAAVALTLDVKPPVAVYGFEPPRVSPDLSVRTLLAKVPMNLYRNGLDLVTDLPPDWQHAALLTPIGKPALPFPNIRDHQLSRILAALA